MAERKISEMSQEELILYKEQLQMKLSEVDFYLKNKKKSEAIPKKTH